jgi:hypothetical protein
MTLREFHNGLRILLNIDSPEFYAAIDPEQKQPRGLLVDEWLKFSNDPYKWFIRAGDAQVDGLWTIIERRMG